MKAAYQELVEKEKQLYGVCKGPKDYEKRLSSAIECIAKRHKVEKEKLWRVYSAGGFYSEQVSKVRPSKRLSKAFVLRFKLIEALTPRSQWWIGQFRPGWKRIKRLQRVIGKRAVKVPRSDYVFFRVLDYDWARLKGLPIILLQKMDAKINVKMITTRRKRLLANQYPVAGDTMDYVEEEEDYKKEGEKERVAATFEEMRKEKFHKKMVELEADKYGWQCMESISAPFSDKAELRMVWKCPELRGVQCPCKRKCNLLLKLFKGEF